MQGRIIKNISNDYTVQTKTGDVFVCKCRGKFRNMKIIPLVGDEVLFDEENNYILEILPRKNELKRPPVSNISQVMILTSVKHPNFSSYLLGLYCGVSNQPLYNCIEPIICFTKLDLLNDEEMHEIETIMDYYKKIGYQVYRNTDLEQIKHIFQDKITVFTGQSGAGKSTLLNHLDAQLQLKTSEISYALGRGKHTTRHVELIPLFGGLVADTPGFSALDFEMDKASIRDQFKEFEMYKEYCKYKDCMHDKEDHCMVKDKVEDGTILKSRYENYIQFIRGDV
mgnify:CR=1 FL=1